MKENTKTNVFKAHPDFKYSIRGMLLNVVPGKYADNAFP